MTDKFKDSSGKEWDIEEEIPNGSYKLVIDKAKFLDKDEKLAVREALKHKLFKNIQHIKNDYKNKYDVGTVEYMSTHKNYSYHTVHIPDGTYIKEANFAQSKPETEGIVGKNLHMVGCNLANIKIDPSWILEHCLQVKYKDIKKSDVADEKFRRVALERHIVKKGGTDWEFSEESTYELDDKTYADLTLRIEVQNGF